MNLVWPSKLEHSTNAFVCIHIVLAIVEKYCIGAIRSMFYFEKLEIAMNYLSLVNSDVVNPQMSHLGKQNLSKPQICLTKICKTKKYLFLCYMVSY